MDFLLDLPSGSREGLITILVPSFLVIALLFLIHYGSLTYHKCAHTSIDCGMVDLLAFDI